MKFIAVKDSLFKTPVFCMQNIYVSILETEYFNKMYKDNATLLKIK